MSIGSIMNIYTVDHSIQAVLSVFAFIPFSNLSFISSSCGFLYDLIAIGFDVYYLTFRSHWND